jgi:hypothetical protein
MDLLGYVIDTRRRQGLVGNTRLQSIEFDDAVYESTLEGEVTV